MKTIPIIRITDMLATSYGILSRAVVPLASSTGVSGQRYRVEGSDGRLWHVCLAGDSGAPGVAISTDARGVPSPSVVGTYHHRMGGHYWTVYALVSLCGVAGRRREVALRQALSAGPTFAEDGRALERIGAWLAQPAALPPPSDGYGQAFMEHWWQARPWIAAWHERAEALHDVLAASLAEQACAAGTADWADWQAYRWRLHELLELQQRLLGAQAAHLPPALRQQGLDRLASLLGQGLPVRAGRAPRQARAS